jgi:hypothetical protein
MRCPKNWPIVPISTQHDPPGLRRSHATKKYRSLGPKTSAKGDRYLFGRLGDARVLVLANTRPEPGDDSTHASQRNQAAPANASRYDGPSNDAAPAEPSETPASRQRAHRGEDKRLIDDDPVPTRKLHESSTVDLHDSSTIPPGGHRTFSDQPERWSPASLVSPP